MLDAATLRDTSSVDAIAAVRGAIADNAVTPQLTPAQAGERLRAGESVQVARGQGGGPVSEFARRGDVDGARRYMEQHPGEIDQVLNAFAAQRPGLVPQLVERSARVVEAHIAAQQNQPTVGNRIWGGVRAVGGGLEAVVGGALVLAPEPTTLTKIGGGVLAAHGADNFIAGFRQLWTGRPAGSLTQQGGEAVARQLGADPVTAQRIGVGVDIGVGLAGSGLAALGRLAQGSRLVWSGIKATQPVYQGTVIPRSFELTAGSTKVWVHGNGTKHLAEYANAMLGRGISPNLVNVGTQVQLRSLQAAVQTAGRQGIHYEQVMRVGGWELIFSQARQAGQLPVLKHALPLS